MAADALHQQQACGGDERAAEPPGANVLVLNATPQYAILAYLAARKFGWHPQIYVSSVCISPNVMDIIRASVGPLANGSRSIAFVKDPTDKVWAKDPVVKLYRSILAKYAPGAKPEDVYNFYGMAVASTMVDALQHAGRNLTRDSLLRAATHLDETNPFMRPGIKIQTSPTSYYPITKAQILRYDVNHWVARGGLVCCSSAGRGVPAVTSGAREAARWAA